MMNLTAVSADKTPKRQITAKTLNYRKNTKTQIAKAQNYRKDAKRQKHNNPITQKTIRPLIVLVGPTASGKSAVAIELAKKINGEIISADSRQVYKYLDIGTAKPINKNSKFQIPNSKLKTTRYKNARRKVTEPIIIDGIPHYLIDIIEPDERYSAGKFQKDAEKIIENIYARKKIPIIVGGTGLYIRALVDGLAELPSANYELRKKLEKLAKKYGKNYLYQRLKKVDPLSAKKIHPNNLPRIIRALEVYYLSGSPISSRHTKTNHQSYQAKIFGLLWERKQLYQRINERVEKMLQAGILNELKKVLKKGYAKNSPGLEGLGYQHLLKYLDGKSKLEEAIDSWKRDTRHYAKRQMTWFKKDKRIHWLKVNEPSNPKKIAREIRSLLGMNSCRVM
jgi:tRNA dimethylallyltransferase